MAEHVYWILEVEIKPDQTDNFKAVAAEMVEATKQDEPGALNYEWSLSPNGKTCHILERYEDSAATMVHMQNFGRKFAKRLMEVCTPTKCTLYGSPSDDVVQALAPMAPIQMSSVSGFSR